MISTNILINIFGWVPLIIFWTLRLYGCEMSDLFIALPAFSVGIFTTNVINMFK